MTTPHDTPDSTPGYPPGIDTPPPTARRRSAQSGDPFYASWAWRTLAERIRAKHHGECIRCRNAGRYTPAEAVHHHLPRDTHPELEMEEFWRDEYGQQQMQLVPLCWKCHEEIETARGNRGRPVDREPLSPERW